MDYDNTKIATTYDAARGYKPDVLRQWLDLIAAHVPKDLAVILDVGCGTGRFTHPLAERFKAHVIGIDPSEKMLQVARSKQVDSGVEFRRAPADRLPLEGGRADVVFLSMILHHLPDRKGAACECRRVLQEGGRVCVRNSTRDTIYPQSVFFPSMQARGELPGRDEVVAEFEAAGLRLCAYQLVAHPVAANWHEFADKLAMRADSFLAGLSDADFKAGMATLRTYANGRSTDEPIFEDIDFFVFRAESPLAQGRSL